MKAYFARVWRFIVAVILRIRADEPLRNRLRPFIAVVSTYLVGQGIVSAQVADIVTGAVLFVLGYGAIEWARKFVTPTTKVDVLLSESAQQGYVDGVKDSAEAVFDDLTAKGEAALKALSPEIQRVLDHARETATYFDNRGEHRRVD